MFTLTSLSSSARSSAILSRIGETAWHGPHHSAQKSTITGLSDLSTSWSKLASVTASAIQIPFESFPSLTLGLEKLFPGDRRIEHDGPDVPFASSGSRSLGPRAGGARVVGRGADLRPAPGAEPRRQTVQLHRRADHREQSDGRPPRLGPDAEGRLPTLQGSPRIRPALPERLRLPGAVGRGRGREVARPELQAGDRGVRARRVRRALQGARGEVLQGDHRAVAPARDVDGLG